MSRAMAMILGLTAASLAPGSQPIQAAPPSETARGPSKPANRQVSPPSVRKESAAPCAMQDARSITVCAQRRQGYRLDPSVMEASREVEQTNRSLSSPTPAAQAVCSSQTMGCGKGIESLDLANVALVVGTAALKAAKGESWQAAIKPGAADEYQLYRQAKRRHEALEEQRAAAKVRIEAKEAERKAASAANSP